VGCRGNNVIMMRNEEKLNEFRTRLSKVSLNEFKTNLKHDYPRYLFTKEL